jgi:hypothetical protein
MQFFTPPTPSVLRLFPASLPGGRQIGLTIVLALALSAIGSKSALAQAQVAPLADVVGLDELETSTADLIRLATSYSDALRELKTARMTVSTLQSLRPAAVITNLEVQVAQINVEAAETKVLIMRTIVEKQLAAAQAKLEIVKYLETMGEQGQGNANALGQSRSRVAQAEATINILKMILALK